MPNEANKYLETGDSFVRQSTLTKYNTKQKAYMATKISAAIEKLGNVFTLVPNNRVDTVEQLPTDKELEPGTVYLVGAEGAKDFDEFYWTTGKTWERMGGTAISLAGYITETVLYKGAQGTGTTTEPASDSILGAVYSEIDDLNTSVDAINNSDTGILAKAKEYADSLNSAMDTRVKAIEAALTVTVSDETIDAMFVD